jgi:hypothetical protein
MRGVEDFGRVLDAWRKFPAPPMPVLMFRREGATSEAVLLVSGVRQVDMVVVEVCVLRLCC